MKNFEISAGSIVGKYHLGTHNALKGKNNQDSYTIYNKNNVVIGIVSDGCGSSPFAEIGANLSIRILMKYIVNNMSVDIPFDKVLKLSQNSTLCDIKNIIENNLLFGDLNFKDILSDYFLNTIIGFCITEKETYIFYIGDGVYWVNGNMNELGPFPMNAPPFMAYNLIDKNNDLYLFFNEDDLNFKCVNYKTDDIENLIVGTDGVVDLSKLSDQNPPGIDTKIGKISEFWENDDYFYNIQNKLSIINRNFMKYDTDSKNVVLESSKLKDDTTMIIARRHSDRVYVTYDETGGNNE